jgi:hypothetical protein
MLNKKVMKGMLFGRQPLGFFSPIQLGDHFIGNMQQYLWSEALVFHHKQGADFIFIR